MCFCSRWPLFLSITLSMWKIVFIFIPHHHVVRERLMATAFSHSRSIRLGRRVDVRTDSSFFTPTLNQSLFSFERQRAMFRACSLHHCNRVVFFFFCCCSLLSIYFDDWTDRSKLGQIEKKKKKRINWNSIRTIRLPESPCPLESDFTAYIVLHSKEKNTKFQFLLPYCPMPLWRCCVHSSQRLLSNFRK